MTLGFSITAAGLFTPILGVVADTYGLAVSLWIGCGALLTALILAMLLRNPSPTVAQGELMASESPT
jgi:FSR family fosmidomycin resistance protein-like MFS transporter